MAEEEEFGTYPVLLAIIVLSFLFAFIVLLLISSDLISLIGFPGAG